MIYVDEFRDSKAIAVLCEQMRVLAHNLERKQGTIRIMEVCGTHTMAVARHGIRDLLPPGVELVSGPGCPVCVTVPGYIDAAVELASRGLIVATFGDLLNVPGSSSTLGRCRAAGGDVRVCYSPLDALKLAELHPDHEVVFLAVGFETTVAPLASTVASALRRGVDNLSFLTALKLIPPVLGALLADRTIRIDAFLCPGHVSAIIGEAPYEPLTGPHGVPCVIAGFEPLDILLGMTEILRQLSNGEARVANCYTRVVRRQGNLVAQSLMNRYLKVRDTSWRGLGVVAASGLELREEYEKFDATHKFGITVLPGMEHPGCACGEVLKGKTHPWFCPLFGQACTPQNPIGPCMVSSEGSCAAYYRYQLSPPFTTASGSED